MTAKTYPLTDALGTAVLQPPVNGWAISYNPDDTRWYVAYPSEPAVARADFAERRNALQYARTHEPKALR